TPHIVKTSSKIMKQPTEYFWLKRFPLIETAGFVLLSLLVIYMKWEHHELWKDEWQAWFVSRDKNLWEILSFLHYEGHPGLWYLFLKPFTWLSHILPVNEEYILSFAHMTPVVVAGFLFWKKLTIPTIIKIAFALSYFFFFE